MTMARASGRPTLTRVSRSTSSKVRRARIAMIVSLESPPLMLVMPPSRVLEPETCTMVRAVSEFWRAVTTDPPVVVSSGWSASHSRTRYPAEIM